MSGLESEARRGHARRAVAVAALAVAACTAGAGGQGEVQDERSEQALAPATPAVGLAIEVENGAGKPLVVKRGQRFWLNQIDVRAVVTASTDEGVSGLTRTGDLAGLDWRGVHKDDQEFVLLANADGTFTRRAFYRDASWMNEGGWFVLEQIDAQGRGTALPVVVSSGVDGERRPTDSFFDRRLRAIQWTYDCPSTSDCTGATHFEEEALVELRYAMRPNEQFTIAPRTTQLRLSWTRRPGQPYLIPVTQVTAPAYAYGFAIDVQAVTPPRADGSYAPGSDIQFRVTLKDGAGNRLHPPGALPSYNDVVFGPNEAGIQYYRAFFDPTTTYWRRKHRERMLMAQFLGPVQNARPIRTIIDLPAFLGPDDVQVTGTLAADGVHSEFHTFPTARDLFGGAFQPDHAAWANPVPDTWTHHVPADAPAGTYFLTLKGRRTFMGEDVPATANVPIQVGNNVPTVARLDTGGCQKCHSGGGALGTILHANEKRETCAGCHVPLGFELEGPIYVRTHFIHSRSRRFDAPLDRCASCHQTRESIQRTSKSACLSCHKEYPSWHESAFGPVESMYVGGGRESFQNCTSTCHTTHPNSGL